VADIVQIWYLKRCFELLKIAFFNTDNAVHYSFENPSPETENSNCISKCFEWEKQLNIHM